MSIDSRAEALPRKNRRAAKRSVKGDISPGLRKHITQAAEKIRRAHKAELADVLKADRAGQLFSRIIGPNGTPVLPLKESSGGSGEGVGSLAGELGGLLTDAIRAGGPPPGGWLFHISGNPAPAELVLMYNGLTRGKMEIPAHFIRSG